MRSDMTSIGEQRFPRSCPPRLAEDEQDQGRGYDQAQQRRTAARDHSRRSDEVRMCEGIA